MKAAVCTGKQDVSGGDKVGTSLFGIVTLPLPFSALVFFHLNSLLDALLGSPNPTCTGSKTRGNSFWSTRTFYVFSFVPCLSLLDTTLFALRRSANAHTVHSTLSLHHGPQTLKKHSRPRPPQRVPRPALFYPSEPPTGHKSSPFTAAIPPSSAHSWSIPTLR